MAWRIASGGVGMLIMLTTIPNRWEGLSSSVCCRKAVKFWHCSFFNPHSTMTVPLQVAHCFLSVFLAPLWQEELPQLVWGWSLCCIPPLAWKYAIFSSSGTKAIIFPPFLLWYAFLGMIVSPHGFNSMSWRITWDGAVMEMGLNTLLHQWEGVIPGLFGKKATLFGHSLYLNTSLAMIVSISVVLYRIRGVFSILLEWRIASGRVRIIF